VGIPLDEPDAYSNNCPYCFGAGKTPDWVFLSIVDIKRGATHGPGDPPPPNGTIQIPNVSGCTFFLTQLPYSFTWQPGSPGVSTLQINAPGPKIVFYGSNANSCINSFANSITIPTGVPYYGGNVQVAWNVPAGPASLQDIADDLGIPPVEHSNTEFSPVDGSSFIAKVVSTPYQTNVLVQKSL